MNANTLSSKPYGLVETCIETNANTLIFNNGNIYLTTTVCIFFRIIFPKLYGNVLNTKLELNVTSILIKYGAISFNISDKEFIN